MCILAGSLFAMSMEELEDDFGGCYLNVLSGRDRQNRTTDTKWLYVSCRTCKRFNHFGVIH